MKNFILLVVLISTYSHAQFTSGTSKQIDQINNNTQLDITINPINKVVIPYLTDADLVFYNSGLEGLGIGTANQLLRVSALGFPEWADIIAVSVTTKGDIQTFNTTVPDRLAVGTDGQVLTADSVETTGLKWVDFSNSPTTTEGDVILRGATEDERLAIGAVDYVLTSDGTTASWQPTVSLPLMAKGSLVTSNGTSNGEFTACADTEILVWDSAEASGVKCAAPASTSPTQAVGDMIYNQSGAAGDDTNLSIGTAGQLLTVAAGIPSWENAPVSTTLTTKGDIQTYDTANQKLAVGVDGTFLIADSAEATGLKWSDTLQGSLNPVTNTEDCTINHAWVADATTICKMSRVGDKMNFNVEILLTDTPAGTLTFNLPNGETIDIAKIANTDPNRQIFNSSINYRDNGTTKHHGFAYYNSATSLKAQFSTTTSTVQTTTNAQPFGFVSGDSVTINVTDLPIVGWSSGIDAVAQFKTLDAFSDNKLTAHISASGVVSRENHDWINGNCVVTGTSDFTCTYVGSLVTAPMNCNVTTEQNTTGIMATAKISSTTALTTRTELSTSAAASARPHVVNCTKSDPDYNKEIIIVAPIDSQKWECQTKDLTADITANTTTIADLTFSNLVIGENYKITSYLRASHINAASDNIGLDSIHNAVNICANLSSGANGAQSGMEKTCLFVAATTTVTHDAVSIAAGNKILGASSIPTIITLCRLPNNYNLNYAGF